MIFIQFLIRNKSINIRTAVSHIPDFGDAMSPVGDAAFLMGDVTPLKYRKKVSMIQNIQSFKT